LEESWLQKENNVSVNDGEPTISLFVSFFLLLKCFKCEDSNKNVIYNLQVRLKHRVNTNIKVQVNKKMGDVQRQELEMTLFRWMLHMEEGLKILNVLILELVSHGTSKQAASGLGSIWFPFLF